MSENDVESDDADRLERHNALRSLGFDPEAFDCSRGRDEDAPTIGPRERALLKLVYLKDFSVPEAIALRVHHLVAHFRPWARAYGEASVEFIVESEWGQFHEALRKSGIEADDQDRLAERLNR